MTEPELKSSANSFIAAAFAALTADRAIPTSVQHHRLQTHVDFSGQKIRGLTEYEVLEDQILTTCPELFPKDQDDHQRRFTVSLYLSTFLEECVDRCSLYNDYDLSSPAVTETVDELLTVLSGAPYDFVRARHVSHLTTQTGRELQIGDVTIVPENGSEQNPVRRIRREIPCADKAWKRIAPAPFRKPHSLLIAREAVEETGFRTGSTLREVLDRFVLVACLLRCGTVQPNYEVAGTSTAITHIPATYKDLASNEWVSVLRRTIRLTGDEGEAIAALSKLIDDADIKREGMIRTSFDAALKKFSRLDDTTDPFEQLVDLATALEGVVLGGSKENEGLTLRLSSRIAALLAAHDDPAQVLFNDVRQLYSLRSVIVHGGELTEKNFRKTLNAISSVPSESEETNILVMLGHAIDRLRDILRRSILARLCLAAGPDPLWPLKGDNTPVDAVLSDEQNRATWRAHWRKYLTALEVGYAADRARPAVFSLGPEDR